MVLRVPIIGVLAPGMGNGAVVQLPPRGFRNDTGVMTAGSCIAEITEQVIGGYRFGLPVAAMPGLTGAIRLTGIMSRRRTTWGATPGVARI